MRYPRPKLIFANVTGVLFSHVVRSAVNTGSPVAIDRNRASSTDAASALKLNSTSVNGI